MLIGLAAAGLSLLLIIYAIRHRQEGSAWFISLAALVAWSAVWSAPQAVASDLASRLTIAKLEYVGQAFIPLAWLGCASVFSVRVQRLTRRPIVMLSVVPLLSLLLAWTNEWHGLVWSRPALDLAAEAPGFAPVYGPWFWLSVCYSFALLLRGSADLAQLALASWRSYRLQTGLLLLAAGLVWLGSILTAFSLSLADFYFQPAILSGAVTCLGLALFWMRPLDIMPLVYSLLLDNLPDGVVVVDTHNRIVAYSRSTASYLDPQAGSPIGQPVMRALADIAPAGHDIYQSLEGQVEHTHGDQTLHLRVSPVYDPQRRLRGRLFIINDITDQIQSEQARYDQQVLAETLRDIAFMLNSTLDLDRVLALILESVGRVAAHDRANLIMLLPDGTTARVHKHRGYSPEAAAVLETATFDYHCFTPFARAAEYGFPVVLPEASGLTFWGQLPETDVAHSFACAPIRVDGVLVGFINLESSLPGALKSDVADRLQLFADQAALAIKNARLYEQTRRQADELNRRIESLTILQRLYKEISFSFNANNLTEIALDAAMRLGRADSGFIALKDDENALQLAQFYGDYPNEALASLLTEQAGIIGEVVASGHALLVSSPEPLLSALEGARAQIALPLHRLDAEQITSVVYGIMVLETRRPERFTEDRLQLLGLLASRIASAMENARLVAAVQTRAAELEQLYDRVSRLEHLKSDMIRIAAHDLKNPLGVLLGYIDQVIQEDPTQPLEKYTRVFSAMLRAAERMKMIVHDILSLERIERMAELQVMQPFDLGEKVQEVAAEFASHAAQKGLTFDVRADHGCLVSGDPVQIHEALANFISNALKYTPEGGQVSVRLSCAGDQAHLEVSDTGYGIPEAQQGRLFEPFYRAKTRETAKIDGTGLGLHLAKNVVERHGGTLIFHSVYGQGSTFGFTLPLMAQAPAGSSEPVPI